MSDKEILEKAIRKAIDGGLTGYWKDRYNHCAELDELEYLIDGNNIETGHTITSLIYDHDFAKALWGEKNKNWPLYKIKDFEFHLQQMVISDDPIKYLGENI